MPHVAVGLERSRYIVTHVAVLGMQVVGRLQVIVESGDVAAMDSGLQLSKEACCSIQ